MSRQWRLRAHVYQSPPLSLMREQDGASMKLVPGYRLLTTRAKNTLYFFLVRYRSGVQLRSIVQQDFTQERGCGKRTSAELQRFLINLLKNHP